MKKLVFLFMFALMFFACEKKIDYSKLEGSAWLSQSEAGRVELSFNGDGTCAFASGRTDGSYSAYREIYGWRYNGLNDSEAGLFRLTDRMGRVRYFGFLEDKTLILVDPYDNAGENIRFRRQ